MDLTVIVGAGGTGSYFIEEVVQYYNTTGKEHVVHIVDGDRVEERNLLRQGFLRGDIDEYKAGCLVKRYRKIAGGNVTLHAHNQFVNGLWGLLGILGEDGERCKTITLVSCVDNNMARLRLMVGAYILQDKYKKEVRFIDSGNSEWTGQTITKVLKSRGKTYLTGIYDKVHENGLEGLQEVEVGKTGKSHIYASIFTGMRDWKNRLNKGDHELSCDVVTETNPQNIGTNMMASKCLLMTLAQVHDGKFKGGEYVFDARDNHLNRNNNEVTVEEGYEKMLEEVLQYLQTTEGYAEVIGELSSGEELVVNETEEVVEVAVPQEDIVLEDTDEPLEYEELTVSDEEEWEILEGDSEDDFADELNLDWEDLFYEDEYEEDDVADSLVGDRNNSERDWENWYNEYGEGRGSSRNGNDEITELRQLFFEDNEEGTE